MKILISGISGSIGRNLASAMNKKYTVKGLSRSLNVNIDCPIIKYDLLSEKLPKVDDINIIIHLASITNPKLCSEDSDLAFKINVDGTRKMLELAKNSNIDIFIYASTGGVYGFKDAELNEEMRANPFDSYTLTKYKAEILCEKYSKFFSVNILRYFFPYGPDNKKERLISRLIDKVNNHKVIELNEDGKPIINPIYIQDLIEGTINACEKYHDFNVFNVAGKEKVSIQELANKIGDILNKKPIFKFNGKNVENLIGDISKAKRVLGFEPKVSLKEGIKRTVDWSDISINH